MHATFHTGKVYRKNRAVNNGSQNDFFFFFHFMNLNENNNICPCPQVFGKVSILALPCQISACEVLVMLFLTVLLHLDF